MRLNAGATIAITNLTALPVPMVCRLAVLKGEPNITDRLCPRRAFSYRSAPAICITAVCEPMEPRSVGARTGPARPRHRRNHSRRSAPATPTPPACGLTAQQNAGAAWIPNMTASSAPVRLRLMARWKERAVHSSQRERTMCRLHRLMPLSSRSAPETVIRAAFRRTARSNVGAISRADP